MSAIHAYAQVAGIRIQPVRSAEGRKVFVAFVYGAFVALLWSFVERTLTEGQVK